MCVRYREVRGPGVAFKRRGGVEVEVGWSVEVEPCHAVPCHAMPCHAMPQCVI